MFTVVNHQVISYRVASKSNNSKFASTLRIEKTECGCDHRTLTR